jgi:hypothetical protein
MKMRPKVRIRTLLAALIYGFTTQSIDDLLLHLLGILLRNVVGALNRRVDLEKLTLLFFFARMKRVVMWMRRRRPTCTLLERPRLEDLTTSCRFLVLFS